MPLAGSGAVMGALILAAIGNPDPAAIPAFGLLGNTIAAWTITGVNCLPGTMVSAGAAVSGFGLLVPVPNVATAAADLGPKLAVAMQDVSTGGIATWTNFAQALLTHFAAFGQVNPATFVAPTPSGGPLTGTGKIQFASVLFAPPLSAQLGVTDPVAAAMLEIFGAQILAHIATHAIVLPLTTIAPFVPYTAPPGGGPISGAGAIT